MTGRRPSLDGFVPRRATSQLGEHHAAPNAPVRPALHGLRPSGSLEVPNQPTTLRSSSAAGIRSEIDESLKSIDTDDNPTKGKKGRRKKGAPKSKARRIIKWIIVVIIIGLLGIGGWLLYKALHASGNIFKGNIFDIVQTQPLKQDANGRSNVLVVGTSEDDQGHDGARLTDSIMVMSIDQKNKNAYMFSIPRDMMVHYNMACNSGYSGKVNEYFNCVNEDYNSADAEQERLSKTQAFIGDIVGLDIQYGVHVNYSVMRELVSAIGGITVTIESRNPNGQMDSNFDWKCGVGDRKVTRNEVLQRCPPSGHFIDYPNGPVNLDAEHALYLAQARGDSAPTYGFEQSNFDREKNQQKIVKAIREKALSAGVLTDFGKVTGIIDALGNNLRTNFETKEIRTLVSLAKDIKSDQIQSISLIDGDSPIMDGNAQPVAGMYQFSALRALIAKKLSSNPVTREEANVVVLNGSGVAGVAKTEADKLTSQGFVISGTDNAPEGTYGDVEVYQIGTGKTATKAKLESLFKIKVKTTAPPVDVATGTNFVVIFGKDRAAQSQ